MRLNGNYDTLSGEVLRTTEKAVLMQFKMDGEVYEEWFPRSSCIDGDEIEEGDTDILVSRWQLEAKGYV